MNYTVITGASSGIGYEAALAFASRGKNLILAARRTEELERLKANIAEIDGSLDVVVRTVDLSAAERVYGFYDSLRDYSIETLINNAGFGNYDPVGEQHLPKIEQMLHLNIEALTILSSLYVRDYADKEGTQLINISSRGGYSIVAEAVTYCATKFYVSAFTEGLAQELRSKNLPMRAKVLAPAATETEFAKRALDVERFEYGTSVRKFHTAEQMAGFLLELFDSDKTVGIVEGATYEFKLQDPIFPYIDRTRN
ncbi:SDR family NAD(P)-dependent oxidoreductase [Saccharibacillus alkalitolerans]|uniref:SDR family NAD(P)-dependent oxidoreductase n=1 Tax=Saccharibacillus alkalitolerans TaxID=2705290 RepID=A0ABX0FEA2_9BACL|nr:SDR family NAD(P)-dependent oxidoreductase [Saccharibacillus alkalitolerans]NGZ77337.1 SDR family NAD(P)-dependent oxidoreductase [Saccharibacillus alkalitolerans]